MWLAINLMRPISGARHTIKICVYKTMRLSIDVAVVELTADSIAHYNFGRKLDSH